MGVWNEVAPYLVQGLIAIITAGVPLVVALFRARTQRLVVEQATAEAEARGHREGLRGGKKKTLAVTLAGERLGPWTRPSPERLGTMVEAALPQTRASVPPPGQNGGPTDV